MVTSHELAETAVREVLDVVSGTRVKMRLGYTEVELAGEQLEALRDMQRCIEFTACR